MRREGGGSGRAARNDGMMDILEREEMERVKREDAWVHNTPIPGQ